MELIYSMRRKPLKCEPPQFERASDPEVVRPIVTISSCNIIAFTSPTELTDTDSDTWGGHVYVCDLDTPWDCHKVVSTTHPVSALEWDIEGRQLLVATTEGEVSVLGQKDFLLNEWTTLYSANFPGEHIIKAVFFHNGRRLIALDKKHDGPITDKIQALRYNPTLKGFGGAAVSGVCCVSMSGVVAALTSTSRATCSLHADHVTHADIAHKNGSLVIACVCRARGGGGGGGRCAVRAAVCAVAGGAGGASLQVHTQPLPALVCDHPANSPPTAISWCLREDTDSLLVAGATLTLWKLSERSHIVHKMLAKGPVQGNTTPGGGQKPAPDCFNTLIWQQAGAWSVDPSSVRSESVASNKLSISAPHVVLAVDHKIHLLNRDSAHYICTRVVSLSEPAAASPPKKPKYGHAVLTGCSGSPTICGVEISLLGGVVVGIDTHAQIHVLRLPQPWTDIPTPLSVQQATSILEYSLVSGYDCLDILLTLKPNIVDAVYERLTETFQRQPAPFQQYYFHSWLKMRIALCRLTPSGASSVSWLTCLATLWASWAHVVNTLRVDERPDDKPLAALLDDHHNDHDKALIALESKAELPSEMLAVTTLRRTLQRVVDIAVTAIASVTHTSGNSHGYELWTDPVAVVLLRKLVVIARGAGLGAGDAAISRLLARVHQHHPPKQDLYEECMGVAAQWSARVWEALPRTAISAPHQKPYPLYLEYLVEPERLRVAPEPPPPLQDAAPPHTMDSIRYMYLGAGCRWRQCARCGARALPHPPSPSASAAAAAAPSPPARPAPPPAAAAAPPKAAGDARFLPACRCGGRWFLVSNV